VIVVLQAALATIGWSEALSDSCVASVTPSEVLLDAPGGVAEIAVSASSPDCTFRTESTLSWITVSPAEGRGSGRVTLTVASNLTFYPRSGSVSIDGQEVTVRQYRPR